jgi:regulatory protein YycH of two-component signal transduction system YycFG
MKKNIKNILLAGLLILALVGTIISIAEFSKDLQEVTTQNVVNLDMGKSISSLP